MTVDTILKRYEVPEVIQHRALLRGAFILALQEAWVGPHITWPVLVKALVFSDLGETSAHIRKKIGLDKYIVTLITRGVPKYTDVIRTSHDWHQKLYLYCATECGILPIIDEYKTAYEVVKDEVERNILHDVSIPLELTPNGENALRGIEIFHYKNPSV